METITFSLSLNTKTKFFSMLLSDTWRNVENAVKFFNILKIETRDKAKNTTGKNGDSPMGNHFLLILFEGAGHK